MTDYKRLTKKDGVGRFVKADCITCRQHKDDNTGCDFCGGSEICNEWCCGVLYNRLAELEDMIEQGTLVQLDKKLIGEEVIGIHKYTNGTYSLDLDEIIVIGFTSNSVVTWNNSHCFNDYFENGYYFPNTEKGKAEAEARLAELRGGK